MRRPRQFRSDLPTVEAMIPRTLGGTLSACLHFNGASTHVMLSMMDGLLSVRTLDTRLRPPYVMARIQ